LRIPVKMKTGQALTEYTIIGLSIATIAIGSLLFLSQSVRDGFSNMLGSKKSADVAIGASPLAQSPSDMGSTDPSDSTTLSDPSPMTRIPDTPITIYSEDLSNSVLTSGANGTTTVLANNIQAVAAQKMAAGELSQAQYNALVDLSNQGHTLADIAKVLESNVTSGISPDTPVLFQGKMVTIQHLYESIGYNYNSRSDPLPVNPLEANGAFPELDKFMSLYRSASQSGALSDPAIQTTVHEAASQIALINMSLDQATGAQLYGSAQNSLTEQIASKLTNSKSAIICNAGNGKDSGTNCQ
jgi:hypothetical protein